MVDETTWINFGFDHALPSCATTPYRLWISLSPHTHAYPMTLRLVEKIATITQLRALWPLQVPMTTHLSTCGSQSTSWHIPAPRAYMPTNSSTYGTPSFHLSHRCRPTLIHQPSYQSVGPNSQQRRDDFSSSHSISSPPFISLKASLWVDDYDCSISHLGEWISSCMSTIMHSGPG